MDGRVGRLAFVKAFIDTQPENVREIAEQAATVGLWKVFVMKQVTEAVHARDLTAFVGELQREPWLLDDDFVWFQDRVIGIAALNDGLAPFVNALSRPSSGDPAAPAATAVATHRTGIDLRHNAICSHC